METFEFRKSREIGDVISGTFAFMRQNWKALGKAMLVFIAPFALLAGAFIGLLQANMSMFNIENMGMSSALSEIGAGVTLFMVFILAASVMSAGVVYQYIKLYMKKGGGDISTQEIWEAMKPNLIVYTGYLSVSFMAVFLGILFCIIPGIYLLVPLSMLIAVKTFEERSLGDAMSRCFFLVKNYWWQTFLTLFVINLIVGVAGQIASFPSMMLTVAMGLTTASDGGNPDVTFKILLTVASAFSYGISSLLGVVTIVGIALQYFSLVERKEGKGAMQRIDSLGEVKEANDNDFAETY
jgi:hypothetical protein